MNILGITDTITDSGIAYLQDDKLLMAVNEERFTRKKIQGGFPEESLKYFLDEFNPNEVDLITIGGVLTPTIITRAFPRIEKIDKYEAKRGQLTERFIDFLEYGLKVNTRIKPESKTASVLEYLSEKMIRRKLPEELKDKPLKLKDHHFSHACSAYYCSEFKSSLVATFDGFGDGYSSKIYSVKDGNFEEVFKADGLDSFGLFYSLITVLCGYKEHRHEGKITGLAALGDESNISLNFPFELTSEMDLKYTGSYGRKGIKELKKKLQGKKKKDIAAWVQSNTEKYICQLIKHYLKETGHSNVALAGGVTANVKLNQRINELDQVDGIYIYPAMSDAGLSHGSILSEVKKRQVLTDVNLGPSFSDDEIEGELKKANLEYEKVDDLEVRVARFLADGLVVARFNGSMEYGPRALGNRSILTQATDSSINNSLNKKLDRTEFMPFAPVIIDRCVDECLVGSKGAELTYKFMNISFDVTDHMKEKCPAAVHVDKTARPQVISKDDNYSFYKILDEYNKITGLPAIINTSFNAHGEPIVSNPEQAIKSFLKTNLDVLAIGNFIIKNDS